MKAGVWEQVRPRVVHSKNIAQALQFVRTGNADLGFVAQALLIGDEGLEQQAVEQKLYSPIRQAGGVLAEIARVGEARRFLDFVAGAEALSSCVRPRVTRA